MSARKVIIRTVFDFKTGRWIEEESFQYDGPWALAGQPGDFAQTAYAFYEDGTESGAVIIGTQDNQQDIDVDTTFHVRVRIQEQNQAADDLETVIWQYNLAGAGVQPVTTTSAVLKAVDGALTEGDTTERLSGGAGSFIGTNAWATEDGDVPNLTYAQNEFCESVLSCQIVGADVSDGQELIVTMAAGTPNITITLGADINIVKAGGPGRRRSNVT
jgi:hypothetical protein